MASKINYPTQLHLSGIHYTHNKFLSVKNYTVITSYVCVCVAGEGVVNPFICHGKYYVVVKKCGNVENRVNKKNVVCSTCKHYHQMRNSHKHRVCKTN